MAGALDEAALESTTFGDNFSEVMNGASIALQPLGELLYELASEHMGDLKEGTADLSDYIRENLPEWKEKFQDFAETAAVKISEVIDKAKEFAGAIRDNWPQIRDTAIRVGAAFIILRGALLALQVVNTVAAAFRTFRAVLLAVRGTQIGLNLAMMANPIGLIIGLIAD